MFVLKLCHVVNIFIYNDPEIVGCIVCRHVGLRYCLRHSTVELMDDCRREGVYIKLARVTDEVQKVVMKLCIIKD